MSEFETEPNPDLMDFSMRSWYRKCLEDARDRGIQDYRWAPDCNSVRINGHVFEFRGSSGNTCSDCDASLGRGQENETGDCCHLVPLCHRGAGVSGVYRLRINPVLGNLCRAARHL